MSESQTTTEEKAALLYFWEAHSQPAFAGLLTGDGWTWDSQAQEYVSDTGTRLHQDDLKRIALAFILSVELQLEEDIQYIDQAAYDAGEVEARRVATWRRQAEETIRDEYLILAALAVGGLDEMTDEDQSVIIGRASTDTNIGSGLSDAEINLDHFEEEILANDAGSWKQITNRSGMYAKPGWEIYQAVRRQSHERAVDDAGQKLFLFERNVLEDGADHCTMGTYTFGCPELSSQGFVPIGTLPPPGMERTCGGSCKCHLEFSLTASDDQ